MKDEGMTVNPRGERTFISSERIGPDYSHAALQFEGCSVETGVTVRGGSMCVILTKDVSDFAREINEVIERYAI